MDTYKHIAMPVKYWGEWCIKRKIQKKVRGIFGWRWKTMETRYFGPYKSYMHAEMEAGKPFEFCL